MSDLGDFKRRVYEPEVAWLKGRISELEQENRSLRADVIELEREAERAHTRADRRERNEATELFGIWPNQTLDVA